MAPKNYLLCILFTLFSRVISYNVFFRSTLFNPLSCNSYIQTCESYLYYISNGIQIEQIASLYSVNASQIKPITHGYKQDYLISVPCTCRDVNGTHGYFYDTSYRAQQGDTFLNVRSEFYNRQAWKVEGEEEQFVAGGMVTMHLVCGCVERESQQVVTYTVQEHDTLSAIAQLLSADIDEIESLNERLAQNPNFIDDGWVLFAPMDIRRAQAPKQGKRHTLKVLILALSFMTLFFMGILMLYLLRRKMTKNNSQEDSKAVAKSLSVKKLSLQNHLQKQDFEVEMYMPFIKELSKVKLHGTDFETERPVIYSLEEIDEATKNFDEIRKIGQGGYGSVYFGILGEQEVAIKRMKSNRSKEFFAELKVLCKIHHINVVELLGYATGDNHLYLVYEYVQNGSLNDHLHDPLLKGHQPLSWTARACIALDTAKGIEYIHDHTKARYVHRDIKTSNILLDQGLRAKVADFGLAKFMERSNEDYCVATRVVGTPGYLPPECLSELQTTSKADVFAFGVVLAELLTGQRALVRDNQEPNKMRSLVSTMYSIFKAKEPETALKANIDGNLKGSYPTEDVYKVAELSRWCLSDDPLNRPDMREIVVTLSQILLSSIEWDASLGGSSQVFSGVFTGR